MAIRLATPKVDLSESILDPTKIPGLKDIRITHPDVATDFDWPEMVSRGGDGIMSSVDAAAPTPTALGHHRTDRDCIWASGVQL